MKKGFLYTLGILVLTTSLLLSGCESKEDKAIKNIEQQTGTKMSESEKQAFKEAQKEVQKALEEDKKASQNK